MPTYTWRCPSCGAITSAVMSIRDYCAAPPSFVHCGQPQERFFEVAPAMALHNALANDRHYENLRAPDGTDISSRAKHREYMRANNLTTADDFKNTWKQQGEERARRMDGESTTRRDDIAQAIQKLSS